MMLYYAIDVFIGLTISKHNTLQERLWHAGFRKDFWS